MIQWLIRKIRYCLGVEAESTIFNARLDEQAARIDELHRFAESISRDHASDVEKLVKDIIELKRGHGVTTARSWTAVQRDLRSNEEAFLNGEINANG